VSESASEVGAASKSVERTGEERGEREMGEREDGREGRREAGNVLVVVKCDDDSGGGGIAIIALLSYTGY
jgi:hypothetical protein